MVRELGGASTTWVGASPQLWGDVWRAANRVAEDLCSAGVWGDRKVPRCFRGNGGAWVSLGGLNVVHTLSEPVFPLKGWANES